MFADGCRHAPAASTTPTTLRIGVGRLALDSPQAGLKQVIGGLSQEALLAPTEDGQLRPWLADSWTTSPDGLNITIKLREHSKFHDGTKVTAEMVAQTLQKGLPQALGPAFDDISDIAVAGPLQVRITLRRPSRFVLEALETPVQEIGKSGVWTGPFVVTNDSTVSPELRANTDYYLGAPAISRVTITPFPSVRSAWAELLRGNLDMLYEVNLDALDSLEGASDVAVYSSIRHYQYMIVFSSQAPSLQSSEVRRELNAVIDRDAIVRDALNGHGVASTGPVPPRHWALQKNAPKFELRQDLAKRLAARHLRFTCLVPADSVYERVALAVKQQLAAASVDMTVQGATQEQVIAAANANSFEAALGDIVSGPTLFRLYRRWYSRIAPVPKPIVSPAVDDALDRIRHARSDEEYRSSVSAFQQAMLDDPLAIFIAWGERARAVSKRFVVTAPDNQRDILNTFRLWRPSVNQQTTISQN
jgi:ABC-type transport system substrate-binding protein